MPPTAKHSDPLGLLPDPDSIRAAIDAADERARLLRLALRSRLHLTTADRLPLPTPQVQGGAPMPDVLSPPLRLAATAPPADPANAPLAVDARRLSALLGIGLRTVRAWDAAGRLPAPVRIGGRVLWRLDELRDWLAAGGPDRETWAAMCAARK